MCLSNGITLNIVLKIQKAFRKVVRLYFVISTGKLDRNAVKCSIKDIRQYKITPAREISSVEDHQINILQISNCL